MHEGCPQRYANMALGGKVVEEREFLLLALA